MPVSGDQMALTPAACGSISRRRSRPMSSSRATPLALPRAKSSCRRGTSDLVGGDDHLAAHLVVDAALVAVLAELEVAGVAEAGLLGAGSVVDARVDDAAVVTGLVLGDLALFLQDDEPAVGVFARERHRRGEADDASADDGDVVLDRSQSHSLRVLANRRG